VNDETVAALERERLTGMPRWRVLPNTTGSERITRHQRRLARDDTKSDAA
jgi:hypothetical protein